MTNLITNGNEVIREIRRLLPSVWTVTEALNGEKMVTRSQGEKIESLEELLTDYRGRLETMEDRAKKQKEVIESQAGMIETQAEKIKTQEEKIKIQEEKLKKTEQELEEAKKKMEKKEGYLEELMAFGRPDPAEVAEVLIPVPVTHEPETLETPESVKPW